MNFVVAAVEFANLTEGRDVVGQISLRLIDLQLQQHGPPWSLAEAQHRARFRRPDRPRYIK